MSRFECCRLTIAPLSSAGAPRQGEREYNWRLKNQSFLSSSPLPHFHSPFPLNLAAPRCSFSSPPWMFPSPFIPSRSAGPLPSTPPHQPLAPLPPSLPGSCWRRRHSCCCYCICSRSLSISPAHARSGCWSRALAWRWGRGREWSGWERGGRSAKETKTASKQRARLHWTSG